MGTAISYYYNGLAGGPVMVESTNGVKIFASEHRNYQTSFSESLGFPDNQLTTKYWFTRYAYNANVKTWILVTNPDPRQSANVSIYIGNLSTPIESLSHPAGTAVTKQYNTANGPVVVSEHEWGEYLYQRASQLPDQFLGEPGLPRQPVDDQILVHPLCLQRQRQNLGTYCPSIIDYP